MPIYDTSVDLKQIAMVKKPFQASKSLFKLPKAFSSCQSLFKLPKAFSSCQKSFQAAKSLFNLSKAFSSCQKPFQAAKSLFKLPKALTGIQIRRWAGRDSTSNRFCGWKATKLWRHKNATHCVRLGYQICIRTIAQVEIDFTSIKEKLQFCIVIKDAT